MKEKQEKEKTSKKKKILGRDHFCVYGPTQDPRYDKCYFCPGIKIKK